MLPKFPNFRKITLADKNLIEKKLTGFEFYSDFVFSNVWTWDLHNNVEITTLHDNLVIKFVEYADDYEFLSFIGANSLDSTARELIEYSNQKYGVNFLNYIPHEIASKLDKTIFQITEDRDGFDYIYSPEEISEYLGAKYKTKRTLYRKFVSHYPDCHIREIDMTDEYTQTLARKIFKNHQKRKRGSEKDFHIEYEAQAFERTIQIIDRLPVICFGLFINNQMIGFSVDEFVHNNYVLSHFIKVNQPTNGAYEFFNNRIARILHKSGVTEWNWVEDLGIKNLKRSKLSYRPSKILEQYKITCI